MTENSHTSYTPCQPCHGAYPNSLETRTIFRHHSLKCGSQPLFLSDFLKASALVILARLHPCPLPKVPSEIISHPCFVNHRVSKWQISAIAYHLDLFIIYSSPYHCATRSYMEAYQSAAKHILLCHQSGFLDLGTTSQNTILWSVMFDGTDVNGEVVILSTISSAMVTKSAILSVTEG